MKKLLFALCLFALFSTPVMAQSNEDENIENTLPRIDQPFYLDVTMPNGELRKVPVVIRCKWFVGDGTGGWDGIGKSIQGSSTTYYYVESRKGKITGRPIPTSQVRPDCL